MKMDSEIRSTEKGEKIQDENEAAVMPAQEIKKPKQKRGANGRFVKGGEKPKSPGRPKKSEELKKLLPKSLSTIEDILNSKKTGDRLKFDVAKWVVEMNIGKPAQQVDAKVEGETKLSAVVLNFEGELETWSE